jgi:peptidoglycan/xylan/chitin deacetylase (PgdA/CDA1 family)
MPGTRTRGVAALVVAGALAATALAPAIVAFPRPSTDPPVAVPAVAAESSVPVVAVVVTPSPGIAAGPLATPDPAIGPDPTAGPVVQPRCAPAPTDVEAAPVAAHGSRDRKVVALTFDDGYNPANTLKILDILRHAKVNATFFVTGRAVELFPAVWREVSGAGFPIADHTYDHHHLDGLCYSTQVLELTRQADAVRDALGHDPVPLMRPPFGTRDANTPLAATAAGDEAVVLWDVDTRDWSGLTAWGVTKRALAGGKGSIVLMHTLYAPTAAALPRIIVGYRARGFRFVTVGELLGVAGPVPFG